MDQLKDKNNNDNEEPNVFYQSNRDSFRQKRLIKTVFDIITSSPKDETFYAESVTDSLNSSTDSNENENSDVVETMKQKEASDSFSSISDQMYEQNDGMISVKSSMEIGNDDAQISPKRRGAAKVTNLNFSPNTELFYSTGNDSIRQKMIVRNAFAKNALFYSRAKDSTRQTNVIDQAMKKSKQEKFGELLGNAETKAYLTSNKNFSRRNLFAIHLDEDDPATPKEPDFSSTPEKILVKEETLIAEDHTIPDKNLEEMNASPHPETLLSEKIENIILNKDLFDENILPPADLLNSEGLVRSSTPDLADEINDLSKTKILLTKESEGSQEDKEQVDGANELLLSNDHKCELNSEELKDIQRLAESNFSFPKTHDECNNSEKEADIQSPFLEKDISLLKETDQITALDKKVGKDIETAVQDHHKNTISELPEEKKQSEELALLDLKDHGDTSASEELDELDDIVKEIPLRNLKRRIIISILKWICPCVK